MFYHFSNTTYQYGWVTSTGFTFTLQEIEILKKYIFYFIIIIVCLFHGTERVVLKDMLEVKTFSLLESYTSRKLLGNRGTSI